MELFIKENVHILLYLLVIIWTITGGYYYTYSYGARKGDYEVPYKLLLVVKIMDGFFIIPGLIVLWFIIGYLYIIEYIHKFIRKKKM